MAKCKKLLAIFLTLAMIVGMLPMSAIMTSAVIESNYTAVFTENFENAEEAAKIWQDEMVAGTAAAPSAASTIENGMLKSAAASSPINAITTISGEYWDSENLISHVSFDFVVPSGLYSWNSAGPILFYDPVSKVGAGVEVAANKVVTDAETGENVNRGYTFRNRTLNNVITDSEGNLVYPQAPSTVSYNGVGRSSNGTITILADENGNVDLPKLHFDVSYTYYPSIQGSDKTYTRSKESVIKITAVITTDEETPQTQTRNILVAAEENQIYNGFKIGLSAHSGSYYTYMDNIEIEYNAKRTDAQYKELFLSRNEEILSTEPEAVTEEHIALLDAALSDYDSMPNTAQLLVSEQKAHLDLISEKIAVNIKNLFHEKHANILEKSVSLIKIADRVELFAALSEYEAMSEFSKECCSEDKALLDARLAAFYQKNRAFNFEDFEIPAYTNHYWTTEKIAGTNDAPATDWSIVNGKLKGSYNSSTAGYIGVTTIKDELWPKENLITKLSFDYYVGGTNYNNVEPVFYYDPESKLTVAWESAKNSSTGIYTSRRDYFNDVITNDKNAYDENMVYPNLDLYSNFNGIGTATNNNYWNENEKGALPEFLHFDVTYNYYPSIVGTYTNGVAVSLLQIRIYISANGETIESRAYNITKKENDTFNGFKFGVVTGSVASDILFDNFVVECELNSDDIEEIADEYIAKHIGILSLKYDEVKAEHKTAVETALAEYETLRDQVKEVLSYEKAVLKTQLRIINGDFEYDANDIASVRKAWNTLKASSSDSEREYLSGLNSILLRILNDYAKNSSATVKSKIKVACVGDSLTNFTKYAEQYRYPAVLQGILGDGYIVEDHGLSGGDVDDMLSTTYTNHIKEFQPDVILLNLGLNDSFSKAAQAEKYYQLIEFYQSLESSPTILLTTSIWSYQRKVSNSDFIRSVADNLDLPFIDMNIITKAAIDETYNNYLSKNDYSDNEFLSEYFENYDINAEVDFANYCASNNITDETVKKALFATLYDWFYYSVNSEGVISFEESPLHFGKEGYKFMAREFKRFFDYSYIDLATNSDGLINLNCYINEWDASYDADVDALIGAVATLDIANNTAVADLVAVYNSLNDVQKLRFEKNFKESYDKLMMASARLASAPIVEVAINEYTEAYGEFLAKGTYIAEDLAAYNSAIADFENQSEVAKYYLSEQKASLDVAHEQIAAALTEEYISTGVTPENPSGVEYKALLIAWKIINGYNSEEFVTVLEARKTIAASIAKKNEAPIDDKIRVLCVGDSLTWGNYSSGHYIGSYPTVLQGLLGDNYHIKNIGINGARIWDINRDKQGLNPMVFLSDEYKAITEQYQPNIVIIMLGTNNSGADEAGCTKGGSLYNYMLEHVDYYRSLESSPTVIMATSPSATNKISNGVDSLQYVRMMQRNIATDENLAFVDIEKLTSAWEPYSEATAETSYFKSDNLHFGDAGYAAIAQEFADYIGELNCEFSTASIDAMDYSAPNFVKKYASLAEAGVTSETVDEYTTMVNEYENLLPKSKEAVTDFRNTISFAETNSSVLENTTTEDAEEVLEIFSNYNEIKDIIDEAEPETAEKIETAITNAGLRPQVLGKTLSVSTSPIMGTVAAKPENDNYIAMGIVFTSYNSMTEQGIRTLTKETPKALHAEREYSEGDVKDETLIFGLKGIMEATDKWGYYIASRSYVVYELEDGTRVTIYNEATHTNPDDATEIDSSAAVRSINSLVKAMATTLYNAGSNDEVNTIEGVNEYEGVSLKEFCDTHDSAILETGVDTMKLLIAYKEVFEKIAQ